MEQLFTADNLLALLTLTLMEIVLGIDNIVFIAILTEKLPKEKQRSARNIGLALAMLIRIGLLLAINWIMGLKKPLFTILEIGFSGRDLIMLAGGLFLIGKAAWEIHHQLDVHAGEEAVTPPRSATFGSILVQVLLLDIVFSLDSVITAVGMAQEQAIMIIAVVISVITMMIFAGPIARFIQSRPTLKMLALSFLILIGVMLVVEGCHDAHVPKGYVYFAMGFSLFVELLQSRARKRGGVTKTP